MKSDVKPPISVVLDVMGSLDKVNINLTSWAYHFAVGRGGGDDVDAYHASAHHGPKPGFENIKSREDVSYLKIERKAATALQSSQNRLKQLSTFILLNQLKQSIAKSQHNRNHAWDKVRGIWIAGLERMPENRPFRAKEDFGPKFLFDLVESLLQLTAVGTDKVTDLPPDTQRSKRCRS